MAVGSELWCPKAWHEQSDSGMCRLPWHVWSLTLLLIVCGVASAAAFAVALRSRNKVLRGARARRTLHVLGGVAVVSLASTLAMTQHAWVGTDAWPAAPYNIYMRWALWSGWYQFGLSKLLQHPAGQKVYIDVGARYYNTSCRWFTDHYPQSDEFKIVAFEVEPRFREYFKEHPEVRMKIHHFLPGNPSLLA